MNKHKHIWDEVYEGPTIHGTHLHVYKCSGCELLDHSREVK